MAVYLAKLLGVQDPTTLHLIVQPLVADGCLQKITVMGKGGDTLITVVSSPELHSLFSDAKDYTKAPDEARRTSPPSEVVDMRPLEQQPLAELGPATAANTIVEFSDFQCPFCKRMTSTLEDNLLPTNKGNIRVIFRNYPLPFHSHAEKEAELAACVARYVPGQFWKVHDFFFRADHITDQNIIPRGIEAASVAGSPQRLQIEHCFNQHEMRSAVQSDIALGDKFGVTATPTLFVNGHRSTGAQAASVIQKLLSPRSEVVQRGD